MQTFTVADLVHTTFATIAFALFFLPPGYLLGLASNAFNIRSGSATQKLLFGIVFSLAATPILAVLLTRYLSYKIALAAFLLLALVSIANLIRHCSPHHRLIRGVRRSTWVLLCMLLAWFLVVQFSLADLQVGRRLYVSYVSFDHSVRIPFVNAASRSGVPPLNPFYGLGHAPILRYYYYWYVVCALPMQLFGLDAKACLNASVFWSGLGLASAIPLFLKYFLRETEHLRSKSVIGIALLTITGLDLLPYAAMVFIYRVLPGDMEWWDPNQVTSWIGSLLWVPHHVAALTACMAGLLSFSTIDEEVSLRQRVWAIVLSGLAFASAAGLSIYVSLAFAIFAILWALWELSQKRVKTFISYVATGAFALLLSWPYLLDLLSKQANAGPTPGTGERLVFFAIRSHPEVLTFVARLGGIHNSLVLGLLKAPILLIVYALEFGFFFLIVVLRFRQDTSSGNSLTRQQRMAWAVFAICLLAVSVLQSDTSGANDFGFRGMLIVQFILLLWAAPIVHGVFYQKGTTSLPAPWIKASMIFTLLMGVVGTTFQLVALRCYAPMSDVGKLVRSERFLGFSGFGERTYWLREGYGSLSHMIPEMASVQYNPSSDEVLIAHLYSDRQAAMGDMDCGSAFGGDISRCRAASPYIAAVFNSPDTVRSWNLDGLCDEFHIDLLVATNTDPVWLDLNSWAWIRPHLLANPAMRAIPCGTAVQRPYKME